MQLEASVREYLRSDAELIQFTAGLISNMTRDNIQFTARGVLVGDRTALETLVNAFEIFPNDDYYRADFSLADRNKYFKCNGNYFTGL